MRDCILLLILLGTSGCGTLANLNRQSFPLMGGEGGTPRVDGGVRNDIRWVSEGVGFPLYFGAIDPVFSLVGDTITLPRVLHERAKDANLMRQNHEGELSVARTIPEKLE